LGETLMEAIVAYPQQQAATTVTSLAPARAIRWGIDNIGHTI